MAFMMTLRISCVRLSSVKLDPVNFLCSIRWFFIALFISGMSGIIKILIPHEQVKMGIFLFLFCEIIFSIPILFAWSLLMNITLNTSVGCVVFVYLKITFFMKHDSLFWVECFANLAKADWQLCYLHFLASYLPITRKEHRMVRHSANFSENRMKNWYQFLWTKLLLKVGHWKILEFQRHVQWWCMSQ